MSATDKFDNDKNTNNNQNPGQYISWIELIILAYYKCIDIGIYGMLIVK